MEWVLLKSNDESEGNNYTVYLIMGSLVVFLFILAPISLIYLADINLLIIIMMLGIFLLISFLIMVLGSFNGRNNVKEIENPKDGVDTSKEIKYRNNFSKNVNNVKTRGNSNFKVNFSKSIDNQLEDIDDGEDERLYSLNMSEEDFYKYRKL